LEIRMNLAIPGLLACAFLQGFAAVSAGQDDPAPRRLKPSTKRG